MGYDEFLIAIILILAICLSFVFGVGYGEASTARASLPERCEISCESLDLEYHTTISGRTFECWCLDKSGLPVEVPIIKEVLE